MLDETTPPFVEKPKGSSSVSTVTETKSVTTGNRPSGESHVWSLSVRSIIALIVIVTVCYMSIADVTVKEPLYTLAGLIVGVFFGSQTKPKTQTP